MLTLTRAGMQGIIDAHVHLLEGGFSLQQCDLTDVRTHAEFTQRVQQACGKPTVLH